MVIELTNKEKEALIEKISEFLPKGRNQKVNKNKLITESEL